MIKRQTPNHLSFATKNILQKKIIVGFASATFFAVTAAAQATTKTPTSTHNQYILSVSGGVNSIYLGHSPSYLDQTDNRFTYYNKPFKNTGMIGAFLGREFKQIRNNSALLTQAGIEYNYFNSISIHGPHSVGIEPSTATAYNYGYTVQSQQIMAVTRLLIPAYQKTYPYVYGGLGVNFTHSGKFTADTSETGSINLTPTFQNRSQIKFAYALGAGVDASISEHIRLGLGYRFTDLGKASLKNGVVMINNNALTTAFTLETQRMYVNQLIAQVSYLS